MPELKSPLADASTTPFRLMIIDGHAMVFRAWFAMQHSMTSPVNDQEVKGVHGFIQMFFKAIMDRKPTHVAITFDSPGPTFRHEQFKSYKAQRPAAPPELHQQVDWVKRLMHAFHIPIFEQSGFEADDLIGSLCAQATEQNIETLVMTGDTDLLQLVDANVRVVLHGFKEPKVYDEHAFRERYSGLNPNQQPDVKGLQGDVSDNIPGVPGIGIKGAIKLIQQFQSIELLYERIQEVEPPRIQSLLRDNEDAARQSKFLTTIVKTVSKELDLDMARLGQSNRDEVMELFRELGFQSLRNRVPTQLIDGPTMEIAQTHANTTIPSTEVVIIDTEEALEKLIGHINDSLVLAFDTESSSINPMEANLVGLSFSTTPGKAYYVPVGHVAGVQLRPPQVIEQIRPILENPNIAKVAHNANYDLTLLANYGIDPMKVKIEFDTMLAAHLLGDRAIGLKAQAFQRLQVEMTPISDLIGVGKSQISFGEVEIAQAASYAAADADMTLRLKRELEPELQQNGLTTLFHEDEMPLIPVLVQMQINGIALDTEMMLGMGTELGEQISSLEEAAYQAVGHQFGLNSPKQLSELLFTELNLTKGKRTQTGYSTDATTLESIRHEHPVVPLILNYRGFTKLKSTYVDTLPELVNPRTKRVHTSYNQAGSATGRISSNDPNLQNIPVRSELGRRVRKGFVTPNPDWLLLAADYSQIELRVLAHLSQDAELIAAFERDEDIHTATASTIYHVPLDEVSAEMRRIAKVMNFGVIYGLSPFGIAQQTNLTREEGAAFISSYFGTYSQVQSYLDKTINEARELGYVKTLKGRRRYIPELRSSNVHQRQAAERMAVNAPVQGTAAEIIKAAMIRIQLKLDSEQMSTKLLLQVHDELILETPLDELEILKALVLDIMPNSIKLSVPLGVDLKIGRTWGDMEYSDQFRIAPIAESTDFTLQKEV